VAQSHTCMGYDAYRRSQHATRAIRLWLHLIMHQTIGPAGYIGLAGNGLLD